MEADVGGAIERRVAASVEALGGLDVLGNDIDDRRVEGENLAIEFRWAEGRYDELPGLAADLVRRKVAVLVSTGGLATTQAAKVATTQFPLSSRLVPIRCRPE